METRFSFHSIHVLCCVSVQIVKFSQPGQNHICPVSDVDMGIYQLQRSEKLLKEKVETLGQESEKYELVAYL